MFKATKLRLPESTGCVDLEPKGDGYRIVGPIGDDPAGELSAAEVLERYEIRDQAALAELRGKLGSQEAPDVVPLPEREPDPVPEPAPPVPMPDPVPEPPAAAEEVAP